VKQHLVIAVCLVLATGSATAGSRETFYGALIGSAVGVMVSHHSGDISTEVAIPAFAALGALIGYGHERGWYDNDPYWGYDPWGCGWYNDYYDYRNRYRPYRRRFRTVHPSRTVVAPRRSRSRRPVVASPNLHPGVTMVVVPVTLSNGVSLDLRILKVNNRFVGPQGEEYESLPSADVLAQRYHP